MLVNPAAFAFGNAEFVNQPANRDLTPLLAHGGWQLVDPRPIATEHPDTFEMPDADELAGLSRGGSVRVLFELVDQADRVRDQTAPYTTAGLPQLVTSSERMWLTVISADDEDFLDCRLENQPYAAYTDLELGASVQIPRTHVIEIYLREGFTEKDLQGLLEEWDHFDFNATEQAVSGPIDPTRPPRLRESEQEVCEQAGVLPERAWPFSAALVSNLAGETWPIHGARFDAQPERGDSGWTVFAGTNDLQEAADEFGADVVRIQEVWSLRERVGPYLTLPQGWGFSMHEDGQVEVYEIED